MRCDCVADGADRPIRGNPFSRGMCQNRAEPYSQRGCPVPVGGAFGERLLLRVRVLNVSTGKALA